MPDFIIVDGPHEGVATITLNRPDKKNALSIALRDEITRRARRPRHRRRSQVRDHHRRRRRVLRGLRPEGVRRAREAGFGETLWASSDRYHRACLEFPLPMIAAVNGAALAGGFDLAVMCDLRIASSTARFGHPEVTFGDVVYGPLHDLVGGAVARDLCFTGRIVGADEALPCVSCRGSCPARSDAFSGRDRRANRAGAAGRTSSHEG